MLVAAWSRTLCRSVLLQTHVCRRTVDGKTKHQKGRTTEGTLNSFIFAQCVQCTGGFVDTMIQGASGSCPGWVVAKVRSRSSPASRLAGLDLQDNYGLRPCARWARTLKK